MTEAGSSAPARGSDDSAVHDEPVIEAPPATVPETAPATKNGASSNGNGSGNGAVARLEQWPVLAGPAETPAHRRFYIPLRGKLVLVALISLAWVALSVWLAIPWVASLSESIPMPLAIAIIGGIAIVPGYLNAHLIASLLIDRAPPLRFDLDFPAITLVVACFNEEEAIEQTLQYACRQEYPGEYRILVADDGSTDRTAEIAAKVAEQEPRVEVHTFPHGGKANTLNRGLEKVTTPLVATVDADTLLMPEAVKRLVARMLVSPQNTVAAAGAVFVRNSRQNLITRAQEWDYFLGIASIKRQQGLFQGTLVAQGAFSAYRTDALRSAGGWPDRIGEDIVLTWAMLQQGGSVTYERTAIAFTEAPTDARSFARQRRRWARGMIEGLREYGPGLIRGRRALSHSVLTNYVFPYVDVVYAIAFPIGIVLACFGVFAIVGPLTLLVLPLIAVLSGIMFHLSRSSFREVGLRVRRNIGGFLTYLLAYQLFMSPVSVVGYFQELFRAKRNW